MKYFYNQIDSEGNHTGTLKANRPINQSNMIPSESHTDHTDQRWTGSTWENLPEEPEPPSNEIPAYDFWFRFTLAQKVAIEESTDTTVRIFKQDLQTAILNQKTVDKNGIDINDGMNQLVTVGILTEAEKNDILDF